MTVIVPVIYLDMEGAQGTTWGHLVLKNQKTWVEILMWPLPSPALLD